MYWLVQQYAGLFQVNVFSRSIPFNTIHSNLRCWSRTSATVLQGYLLDSHHLQNSWAWFTGFSEKLEPDCTQQHQSEIEIRKKACEFGTWFFVSPLLTVNALSWTMEVETSCQGKHQKSHSTKSPHQQQQTQLHPWQNKSNIEGTIFELMIICAAKNCTHNILSTTLLFFNTFPKPGH